MTRILVLLTLIAGIAATTAYAQQPPATQVQIGSTHAQPVAGKLFTGATVTNLGWKIQQVRCDARLGGKTLPALLRRFYAPQVDGPAAVTCSWQLPADSGGKLLTVNRVYADLADGNTTGSVVLSWRIR